MNNNQLITTSIKDFPYPRKIIRILGAALDAVDPIKAVENYVHYSKNTLSVKGQKYDLRKYSNVFVVGAGKAALPMTTGLVNVLKDRISGGIIILKHIPQNNMHNLPKAIKLVKGNHPIPDIDSVQSTKYLVDLLQKCKKGDLIICLISGGGSALLSLPVEGITLADLQGLTQLLLSCSAEIGEINTLRKHLDLIKGGGLARLAYPAELITLILSDVIGSPLDVIASGPTVADPTTFLDAIRIIRKYSLENRISKRIQHILEKGLDGGIPETVKEGDLSIQIVNNVVIASNQQAAKAAVETAHLEGFNSMLLTTYLRGEARQVGMMLAAILREIDATDHPIKRPACIVVGGETTVSLSGNGFGGRNLEVALGAVEDLSGLKDVVLVTLATDGEDGPTDAAGAVVTGETLNRSENLGLNPIEFLHNNDSYNYFQPLGDLVQIGPTGTNVNDLTFLFAC